MSTTTSSTFDLSDMPVPEVLSLVDHITAGPQGRQGRGLLPGIELLVLSDKLETMGYLDTLDDEQRSMLGLACTMLELERSNLYLARLVESLLGRAWMLGTRLDRRDFSESGCSVRYCGTLEWELIHEPHGDAWRAAAVQAPDIREIVIPRPRLISAWSRAELLAEIGALYLTPRPWGERAEVHALATRCESDRGAFTKAVKKIARDRFNAKLFAFGGRHGTGYNWVTIERDGDLAGHRHGTIADQAAMRRLSEPSLRAIEYTSADGREPVLRVHIDGARRWLRGWAICSLAGHPLPAGVHVDQPRWADDR